MKKVLFLCQMSELMVVIANVIYEYLESNRRITVPMLGTFLTKGSRDTLLFSEFMKSDDGVLRSLLIEGQGLSELEATDAIEAFVCDIRSALESDKSYEVPPMGRFKSVDGAILFENSIIEIEEEEDDTLSIEEQNKMVEDIFDSLSSYQESTPYQEPIYQEPTPTSVNSKVEPKAKFDIWVIVALVAGFFALFALLYGIIVEWQIGDLSFGSTIDNLLFKILG
ncbi:MAG: hypothetical protein SNH55_05040 [Rikenellaceae bacterium]